jgi:hypothetical protein
MEDQLRSGFDLNLPVELVRVNRPPAQYYCQTKHIGSKRVVLNVPIFGAIGDAVEFVIKLPVQVGIVPVQIRCFGIILRHGKEEVEVSISRYSFERLEVAQNEFAKTRRPKRKKPDRGARKQA